MKVSAGRTEERAVLDILACDEGFPIEAMERLIAAGPAAVAAVHAALERHLGDEDQDLIPLLAVLGELRSPDSIPLLAGILRRPDLGELLLDAAAEALGKLGAAAVPALVELLESPEAETRFWALGALGRVRHPAALAPLRKVLGDQPELCGLAANGLAELGDKESIQSIYETYAKLPETDLWLPDLRDAVAILAGRLVPPTDDPEDEDWRARWRRRPGYGWTPAPSALVVSHILWSNYSKKKKWRERRLKKESFEYLTTTPQSWSEEPEEEECDDCGEKILKVASVPVCPELAFGSTLYQEDLLQQCLKDGITTLPAALDDLDQELLYGDKEWDDLTDGERDRWLLAQQTYEFFLLDGRRTIQDAVARIRELRAGLGKLWDLPQEEFFDEKLLQDEASVMAGLGLPRADGARRQTPKVGRNDPCPCGSGKKHKKCCAR